MDFYIIRLPSESKGVDLCYSLEKNAALRQFLFGAASETQM